ncbi:DUF3379 family protein [Colwellia psychrerythraea]|uniref:DUF3379 domain-containing protein n=1 Tax=Colwellia psychrerythraea TaxID=28229 RepID=A0A099KBF4_COLPS|nr:DUF3379 family protein [Colwellia psychrerythraea]KGJ87407.1 Protein of unknown function DUF3379 [Colwellia psychrerythraea]
MDDLQFRRAIYADPNNQDAETIAAQQNDASKKQFAQEICQLDEKIMRALQVPVPEGLSAKLILRQTLASHQVQKRKTRVHLALAASVAIVGGLMLNFMQFSSAYTNLGDYALAHVYHEQGSFANNAGNQVTLSSLNKKMAAFDGNFSKTLGNLIFADYCRFDGMKSLHLVFQGITSPVTVFIVPKNKQLSFSPTFNDNKLFGSSLEFNRSNIIVVADKNESLGQWQKNISETVSWSI